MALKKTATSKKAETKAKAPTPNPARQPAPFKTPWTLPIALIMVIFAAGALWLATRESSNAPQAATPAVTHASMTADAGKTPPAAPAVAADTTKADDAAHASAAKPVSVSGCLERGGDGFVLKNADGADAPKARSWKSGFLKRSAASIDLRDAANAAHLGSHVGQRVSVTGPLVDREMRVQSLRRLAATCQ